MKCVNWRRRLESIRLELAEQRQLRSRWQTRLLGAKNRSGGGALYPTPVERSVLVRVQLGRVGVRRVLNVLFSFHLAKSTLE